MNTDLFPKRGPFLGWQNLTYFFQSVDGLREQAGCVLHRRYVADAGVRSRFVVVATPRFDDQMRLLKRVEPACVEALVAEVAVEALAQRILYRLAGSMKSILICLASAQRSKCLP